ncbi:NAD(P)H-binding protein [Georgenia sp. EYE_87]|uniref:NAD(P)-dependent oxidoreductase n=1 Tax=Georgenia sp. EYE_87 TaxID=2853448 RepID=UPI0020038F5A|nr:NAD(P)H-binding protein [Georgenia sp. EYE_87]MCK6210451.1 NAD(P)H-binding protein [Georgenia sp. EYE_87]
MKIAVYGATGMIGREILAEAAGRGHDVRGYSRSGGDGVAVADLGDTERFQQVAAEHDAVIMSLSPDRTGGSHAPLLEAYDRVIAARPGARLIPVVGAGSLEVGDGLLLDDPQVPELYRPEMVTMREVLEKFRASEGLDWTAVSPAPQIAPGERTGSYRTAADTPAGEAISTKDLAVAILDELENPQFRGRRFTAAS